MSFLTPALTAGALLIALPIVLHLVMRRRPQQLVFPALRFVRNRRSMNQTRLRLRHLLLLALRCAAIALLAFALARPVLQGSGLQGGAAGGVNVAVVMDNSARMQYRSENQTRLEAAKETADWLLGRLPADSQVAVADLASAGRLVDRDAARLRVGRVRPNAQTKTLDSALRSSLAALPTDDTAEQEVFLFTDRTQGSLSDATLAAINQTLADFPRATLHLVDVGVDRPVNLGLASLELSSATLAVGQTLDIDAVLTSTGPAPDKPVSVELWINGPKTDGKAVEEKRGEQLITLASDGGQQRVEFSVAALPEGVHQGRVRIVGNDPLPADDVQYFTVSVEAPRRVLLVAPTPASAVFVREALAPSAAVGQQVYQVEVASYTERWENKLDDYRAVLLLDPPPLGAGAWRTLANYVSRGGGAGIFLGRNAQLEAFNAVDAQQLLPGELQWKSRDATYLRPVAYNHPALSQLAELADALPWSEFPVFTYWSLADLDPTAVVVAPYANGEPAIIERRLDRGRVLTVTTPFSDAASNEPWNLLPTGIDPWPFLALVDNLTGYLCGAAETRRNYLPGETALLPLATEAALPGYVLRLPSGDAVRQTLPVGQTEVVIGMTEEVGNYRVQAGGGENEIDTGFSVTPSPEVGQLERRPLSEVAAALPEGRFFLSTGRDDLAQQIDVGRTGRELYPWLITLVALALGAESWVANRFYGKPKT